MRMILSAMLVMILMSVPAFGQLTIWTYDEPRPDTLFITGSEGSPTYLTLTVDSSDKVEGGASMVARASIGSFHPWGSFAETQKPYATPQDWRYSDTISVWFKVVMAPQHPDSVVFRIALQDKPGENDAAETWFYENTTIVDAAGDWVNLRVPIIERATDGSTTPNDQGFVLPPTNWQVPGNDKKLNLDKIVEWRLSFVTTSDKADSLEVKIDNFELMQTRNVPAIFFNGKDINSAFIFWNYCGSTLGDGTGQGTTSKGNALVWNQNGDACGGVSGFGYNVDPAINLAGSWNTDSVKVSIKTSAAGPMIMQFESGAIGAVTGKVGKEFTPTADGAYHDYVFALKDMTVLEGTFDPSKIVAVGWHAAQASAVTGNVIYITNWWTGSPEFDVIPPDAVSNLAVVGGSYLNLMTWDDLTNESNETYNIYYSENSFTATNDNGVEDLPPYNVPWASTGFTHQLRSPKTDKPLTYYYGIMAKDASGNEGPLTVTSASVTTTAKGVPTISKTAPPGFVADGSITEWAGIDPIVLSVQSGTAYSDVAGYQVTTDADLSAKAYLAFDDTTLYVAIDVTDDVVDNSAPQLYQRDRPDLFIGLYDFKEGMRHSGLKGGSTPDYHFAFNSHKVWIDNPQGGVDMADSGSANYTYVVKTVEPGYIIEAKFHLDSLRAKHPAKDLTATFKPVEGYRIAIDFSINDHDGSTTVNQGDGGREGIIGYSPLNADKAHQNMFIWTHTWIGDLMNPATSVEQIDAIPQRYELSQNFPNPFNPTTQIHYSLERAGRVTLRVFDLIGREVATLVDSHQEAGSYTATFNTREITGMMSTGVYFYRLDAGEFTSIKKMVLLK